MLFVWLEAEALINCNGILFQIFLIIKNIFIAMENLYEK